MRLSYPVLEKVVMWVNIQCKVSLKTEGDHGKSIIYAVKGNMLKELETCTNKEFILNQKRSCSEMMPLCRELLSDIPSRKLETEKVLIIMDGYILILVKYLQ